MQLRQREQFVELISKISSEKVSLEPDFFPDLLELVKKLLDFPQYSRMCTRYIEAFMLEVKFGTGKDIHDVFGANYSTEVVVLSKHIIEFFLKSTGVSELFVKDFMAL